MATLSRYSNVPGWEQDDPIDGPTENFSMPFAGQGGSNPMNPDYYREAGPNYYATSPLADYGKFRTEYDFDTSFGMLGSYFGPNARKGAAEAFDQMYDRSTFTSFGYGGTDTGVNVLIDWDLANKQAEWGTAAYFRKLYQDAQPTNTEAFNASLDFLASRNAPFNTTRIAQQADLARTQGLASGSPNYYSYSSKKDLDNLTDAQRLGPSNVSVHYTNPDSYAMTQNNASYGYKLLTSSKPRTDWNEPNINMAARNSQTIFSTVGGYGIQTFGANERLAPTSISKGTGLFSSAKYSLSLGPKQMNFSMTPGKTRSWW